MRGRFAVVVVATMCAALGSGAGCTRRDGAAVEPTLRPKPSAVREVQAVLDTQTDAWNRGDLDAFMAYYWHSPSLTFSSGGATTRGWDATAERYRRRYPDAAAMGRVSFDGLEYFQLDERAMLVLGNWRLQRGDELFGGNFSLALRRFAEGWRIVHDHTSVKSDP